MEISKVMVIGAGQMGSGIAQVAAQSGFTVVFNDLCRAYVVKALAGISRRLDRSVDKSDMTPQQREATLGRIVSSTSLEDVAGVDLVIEAVPEELALKQQIFRTLDRSVQAETILATNTSSLPITEIAAVTRHPERVVGMHFMNPVPVMELVELVRGIATNDKTFRTVQELAGRLGKTPVAVNDSPGFVSNRVLMPLINEAIYCVYEGVAAAEDVDRVMTLGMRHPMGPLTLADFVGLDTCLAVMETLCRGFADSKYRPCPLLRKMVQAGWLGQKSGRGFYEYPRDSGAVSA